MKHLNWKQRMLAFLMTFLLCIPTFFWDSVSPRVDALTMENGLSYWIENETVTITSCPTDATEIIIPDSVNDIPVVAIRENAFSNCKQLTDIFIPSSIRQIGQFAFFGCELLTSITLGSGVVTVSAQAFCGCTSLTTVSVGANVTNMDASAFSFCINLTNFRVSKDNPVFSSADGILFSKDGGTIRYYPEGRTATDYQIPAQVHTIGNHAFFRNTALATLVIPDTVTTIAPYAFSDCAGITKITFGTGVQTLGQWAFAGCTGLAAVIIPNTITTIETMAFYRCLSLDYVRFGKGVATIGYLAFGSTPWLTAKRARSPLVIVNHILVDGATCVGDVTIPDTVTAIADGACYNGKAITAVTIPVSVQRIGVQAFAKCAALRTLTILNPDCTIVQADDTLGTDVCIAGYADSTAQSFANTFHQPYQSLGSPPETTTAPIVLLMGDVNCDGVVDIGDVILLNRFLSEDSTITVSTQGLWQANCDASDAALNGTDTTKLLQWLARLIPNFTS